MSALQPYIEFADLPSSLDNIIKRRIFETKTMIEGKVSAFVLLLVLVGSTRCCASDPKKKCLFSVVQEDGSKHTYDFSGQDYDMVYDGTDFQIIMNLCNTAARACYPSTCYDTGNVLHNFEGKPCLPWNATVNTGNIVFFSTQGGGPPDVSGRSYPSGTCPNNYEPAKKFGCVQEPCYSAQGKAEHCTKSCAVVSNSQPMVQLQYVSFVLETTVEQ